MIQGRVVGTGSGGGWRTFHHRLARRAGILGLGGLAGITVSAPPLCALSESVGPLYRIATRPAAPFSRGSRGGPRDIRAHKISRTTHDKFDDKYQKTLSTH